ncbi:MAG TPA: hypothetical protein VKG45_07090 [Actinomycetes bacterium]|nr:hypothetical protein [Actinomycetes bacterium]
MYLPVVVCVEHTHHAGQDAAELAQVFTAVLRSRGSPEPPP